MATSPVSARTPHLEFGELGARAAVTRVAIVRRALLLLYAGFALGMFALRGVPFDREQLILWVCGALALVCVGRPPREIGRLARDWLPFALLLIAYDYTRGLADTLGMPVHMGEMISVDRLLGLGEVPTVWLQERLYDAGAVRWYDVGATVVYHSHFFAVYVIAGVLWARNRARFGEFVRRFLALTFAGLATYVLFPAAPPWMAARDGEIDAVARASGKGWSALGLDGAEALLHKGQAVVNQVAAVPSLHAAFAAFICVFFWAGLRWPWRAVLAAYPVAMGFALVYSAEHYAADVLLGWVYVALVMLGVGSCERRWRRRSDSRPERIPAG
jgi:membrane-associated phospholipid phosphatase